ncbi:hypothetical protein TNCV_3832421 [Trichonephila clavipes]|nr:hypothetical protein TNCV_3832421 [Trichonephila clavipes]
MPPFPFRIPKRVILPLPITVQSSSPEAGRTLLTKTCVYGRRKFKSRPLPSVGQWLGFLIVEGWRGEGVDLLGGVGVESICYCFSQLLKRGNGNLVVKVMETWPACHEFKLSATEDSLCRGGFAS